MAVSAKGPAVNTGTKDPPARERSPGRAKRYSIRDRQYATLRAAEHGPVSRTGHDGRTLYHMELRGWISLYEMTYSLTDSGRRALLETPELAALRPEPRPAFLELAPAGKPSVLVPGLAEPIDDGMADVCCDAFDAAVEAKVLALTERGDAYIRGPQKLWPLCYCPFCGVRRAASERLLGGVL